MKYIRELDAEEGTQTKEYSGRNGVSLNRAVEEAVNVSCETGSPLNLRFNQVKLPIVPTSSV